MFERSIFVSPISSRAAMKALEPFHRPSTVVPGSAVMPMTPEFSVGEAMGLASDTR